MTTHVPHVVIVGGGFGGLAAAKALGKSPAHVTLIDRNNHHVFQPLLYQVATSVLSPGQIGAPIREVLAEELNVTVILGEVTGVDKERQCALVNSIDRQGVTIDYDYLILATGVRHSYFGHDEFAQFAPGLKGLADAVAIRNKILRAFEQAEAEEDPAKHRDLLTFVLVGAGPTGVELAGAIAVLVRTTLQSEFRRIDPMSARIILLDMAPRILGTFPERLSTKATKRLEKLGVEVRLGHGVDKIDDQGVIVAGERIASNTVIWTAGVAPSPAGKWLGVATDRAGRVRVQSDCSVPGHPEVFVIGDTASFDEGGKPLPGVAQVAMQQGHYVGKLIHRRLVDKPAPPPFRYFDKGNMAVVGKGFAVLQSGPIQFSGYFAWLAWAFIHIQFLAMFSMRVSVFLQWIWTYFTGSRGSRLIVNHYAFSSAKSVANPPTEPAVSRPVATAIPSRIEPPQDGRGNGNPATPPHVVDSVQ
jgi:NADH:quinone reductase (non-electrogenic)